jgi:hypothetical protein
MKNLHRLDLQGSQEQVRQGRMPSLVRTREAISRALSSISKELIWKVRIFNCPNSSRSEIGPEDEK